MKSTTHREQGSSFPAILFALVIVIVVAHTIAFFLAKAYQAPVPITGDARAVDHQYHLTLYVSGVLFVLSQLALAFAVFVFRDRGQQARHFAGTDLLEYVLTVVVIILFLGLGAAGHRAWAAVRYTARRNGAVQIEVTGVQFQFMFRYPGPDGTFGRIDPTLISAATGNPLGLDPASPGARDDIVTTGTLGVPIGRPVELLIRSQDVIHNFFVRELRLQQDAVPGLIVPIHFTADQIGRYDIVCTQLCGLGHQKMHAVMQVMSESEYEAFLKQQAATQ